MMDEGDLDLLKDVPGFKAILRAVLKSQMKHLVDQLSRHGDEEAMLLTTSISDGSFYHMGSKGAEGFLESRGEIQPQFLSHCMKSMQDNTDLTENAKSVVDRSEDQNSSNTQCETSKSTVIAARQQSRSVASPVSLIRVGEETLTITNVQETAGTKAGATDSKKKRARGGRKRPSETDISVKPSKRLTIAENDTLTSESQSASYEIGKRIKEMPSYFVKTEGTLSVKDGKPKDADSSDTLPPSFTSSVSSEAKNKSDGTAGDSNVTEQSLPEFDESREIKVEPIDDDEAADFEESTSQLDFSSGLTTTDGDDKDAPDSKSAEMPDMFNVTEWARRAGLKPITENLLRREDLDTHESLVQLSDTTIDKLDLTVGQQLMLKEAVKQLKNGASWIDTPDVVTSKQPTATDTSIPETGEVGTRQLTILPDGGLGPEIVVEAGSEPETTTCEVPRHEIIQKSKIYFNLNENDKLYDYHKAVNDASEQLCIENPTLLSDRKELFTKARKLVHDKGYMYKKKKSRTYEKMTEEADSTSKKARLSGEYRSKKIRELGEDLSEIDIEMRLITQQREKYKNVNDLNRAISSTERLGDLREKKRTLQDELTALQMKEAKVAKAQKSIKNKQQFLCNQDKQPGAGFKGQIDTFFKKKGNVSCETSASLHALNEDIIDEADKADDRTVKSAEDFV